MATLKENLKKISTIGKRIIATEVGEPIKTLYGVEIAGGGFGVIPKFYYFNSRDERDRFAEVLKRQELLGRNVYYFLNRYTMKYYRNVLDQYQVVSKEDKNGEVALYAPTEDVNVIMEFNPKETIYTGDYVWEKRKGRLKEELEEFDKKGIPVDMIFKEKKSKKSKN